jgi:hypothetical protein
MGTPPPEGFFLERQNILVRELGIWALVHFSGVILIFDRPIFRGA